MTAGAAADGMRVICLITHNEPGGALNALFRLAEELARRGHRVDVWPLYGCEDEAPHIVPCSVVLPRSTPGLFGYARIIARLVQRLRATRPDAVVSFLPFANVAGQLAALMSGVPNRVASQRNPSGTYGRFMRVGDRIVGSIGVYTRNIANSDSVRSSFGGYPRSYVKRLLVVHNGLTWPPSGKARSAARAKFGLPIDDPVIVNVARMSRQKNQSLLLHVASRLPAVHLAIAGDGELRKALRDQAAHLNIEGRVHFLGLLDQASVADLLAAADLFVHPSRFEGHSNALLEAMNAGIPILASDIAPQVETLCGHAGEPAGRLLDADDEAGWTKAIESLLNDAGQRRRLAARARERAADFSIERMADGFERAIRCAARPPPDLQIEPRSAER